MSIILNLAGMSQEYGSVALLETEVDSDPIKQFTVWFEQHAKLVQETPNAMVLSTVDAQGLPDSRVVLLKGLDKGKFVFYTNYYSTKGLQLECNPHAALNFFWPELMRQVRVRGIVSLVSEEQADEYFSSRPFMSQLSAIVSKQSQEISSRDQLLADLDGVVTMYSGKSVARPKYWGGYELTPQEIEFWQGRDDRLHDRIHYCYKNNAWCLRRLAP